MEDLLVAAGEKGLEVEVRILMRVQIHLEWIELSEVSLSQGGRKLNLNYSRHVLLLSIMTNEYI